MLDTHSVQEFGIVRPLDDSSSESIPSAPTVGCPNPHVSAPRHNLRRRPLTAGIALAKEPERNKKHSPTPSQFPADGVSSPGRDGAEASPRPPGEGNWLHFRVLASATRVLGGRMSELGASRAICRQPVPTRWRRAGLPGPGSPTRERLVLTLDDLVIRKNAVQVGQRLTLRPRSVDPRQQR